MAGVSAEELRELEERWEKGPSPLVCSRLADLLRREGRTGEALAVAAEGLKRWRTNASISIVMGRCYQDSGRLTDAATVYESVLEEHPRNLVALKSLAMIHYSRRRWARAVEMFEEYLFEHPGDDEARERMEEASERAGESEDTYGSADDDGDEPDEGAPLPGDEDDGRLEGAGASATDAGEPLRADEQGVPYPRTSRMEKVLREQGIEEDAAPADRSLSDGAPRKLLDLFSEEERLELGLSPYGVE